VIAGGVAFYIAIYRLAGVRPAMISAVGGAVVAAGLVIGMQFEGWLDSALLPGRARVAELMAVAIATAMIYLGLTAYAHATGWTRAAPEEWVSYAGLNAIGIGVILHVAIGHRWPFAHSDGTGVRR
jgi:protein-S-isoprenylcysteine O-methyltransferase Ste14